ncbi:hypothetical protein Tco_0744890 [Tanacetum coccineum]
MGSFHGRLSVHRFLRCEGLEYPDTDIVDFEGRLARIHIREVHRVLVFDFGGLLDLMAQGLTARMTMEHHDEAGVSVFTSRDWRRMFDIRGPLVHKLILEFFSTFRFGQAILDLDTLRTLQFQLGGARRCMSWRQFILALRLHTEEEMQTAGDFLGTTPSYTAIRDPILRLCHRLISCSIFGRSQAPEKVTVMDLFYLRGMDVGSVNVPYLLARYLRLFDARRKSRAHIFGGQFVARLVLSFMILRPSSVLKSSRHTKAQKDYGALRRGTDQGAGFMNMSRIKLKASVAMGPERQPDAAAGAPADAEDASIVDEGG